MGAEGGRGAERRIKHKTPSSLDTYAHRFRFSPEGAKGK